VKQKKSGFSAEISTLFSREPQSRLRRLTLLAQAALLVERLAAALAPAAIVAGFFVALSWTGLWLGAPVYQRIVGTAIFLVLLALALSRARRFSFPTVEEARAALDGADPDAPATALSDALANDGDPQTQKLWRLHLRRAEKIAARLRPVAPAPRLWALDPYALGALAVLALCVGAFLAGPQKYARLAAAFDWRWRAAASEPARIDAWIDPPAYTGKPPIVLALNAPAGKGAAVAAPVGSSIVVRASDKAELRVAAQGGIEATPDAAGAVALQERRFILRGDGSLRVSRGASEIAQFSLRSLPDVPPTITPLEAPQANLRGTFVLAYRIEDDYGARDAKVAARPKADAPPPLGHALVAPPGGPLDLPAAPGGLGDGRSTLDWSDSPYAGAPVDLILSVHDDGGNEGQAVLRGFVLPKKNLTNPLALALAEQRRLLALDSGQREKVLSALEALMIAPELFTPKPGVYLGLRYAHTALRYARGDDDLVAVADFLWDMALRLEEGDAPQAERDLRAAQKALRDALNRGAPPEEIARLTQQLQKALDAFLAEMAKKSSSEARSGETEPGDGRSVTAKDFKAMLDQLAEAAKDGDKEAAMELLDRMQDMLENLRQAEKSGDGGKAARNRRTMRDLDKMMREQQKLRDDTYAEERGAPSGSELEPSQNGRQPPADGKGRRSGKGKQGATAGAKGQDEGQGEGQASGESEQDGADAANADPLDQRQGHLRDKLDALQRRAKNSGATAPKSLDEAEEAMRQAEQSLRQGDDSAALEAQGRAMEDLRKGAGEMAKQAQQGDGGPGEEEGQAGKEGLRGQNGEGPFGHASRQNNVDATGAHKARKVLEELRRRLSDPSRAREELDYLERLIKPD
jgi:uncharacterized protein (TIGR02302 family)